MRQLRVLSMAITAVTFAAVFTVAAEGTPVQAATGAVIDGNARFQVLSPTLVRLEYAGDGLFQDATTFNAVNRAFPTTTFTTTVTADGYREISTGAMTLRYRRGSGPFTPANTSVTLATGVTAAPAFPSYCAFGTVCEAENALFGGSVAPAYDHSGNTGSAFVAGYERTGSTVTQDVAAVPSAGPYRLWLRYANAVGSDNQSTTRTLSTRVNGAAGPTVSLPPTGSWDTWSTVSTTVTLAAGVNSIAVTQGASDSGRVNLDGLAVTSASATGYPAASNTLLMTGYGAGPKDTLGGWSRSLDNPRVVPVPEHPGILDRSGWYLLDDTRTALFNAAHTVSDRPSHGSQPYQDGYFFGYGQSYRQALTDLNTLTGGTALLPQSAYGVWYSRYFAYSAADYTNTLLPAFRGSFTPIDWLVIDTDFKSPSQWNGWNWNSALFPDPPGFMNWTRQQGLAVSLNIHPSIAGNDPRFATANSQAGGLTPDGSGNYAFDWSRPAHLAAYLNLHEPFEQQGVRTWWLDYCTGCGGSTASNPHVAPDNLINQAYADDAAGRGLRGFSFARIGGSEMGADDSNYAVGPWSERRNTMQFTGDTPASWDMLAFEVRFTADAAAAGLSNISHDIGSFHGGHLPDDLYARWVQLGTFQPIDRLHSDHGDRLPWNYTGAAASSAQTFLRLREALVPYTYTLARQAQLTGIPIVRPMYLNYPTQDAAYAATNEYLYGDNVLVAPITSAGNSVNVWVPPGTWTDYFTGRAYTGPANVTISAPLTQMPVLVKAGGILPTRTDYVDNAGQRPLTQLTVNVTAGASGSFSLFQDAGEGTGYLAGQSTTAPLSWNDAGRTLTVGAQTGGFPGAPASRAYTLRLANSAAPTAVSVDGTQLPETAWAWNPNSRTVTVTTGALPLSSAHTITLTGTATANPTAGEVRGDGGLCLATDGTGTRLAACDHTAAQQFSYQADGTMRVLGKCLTVDGLVAPCDGSAAQAWRHQADGALLNPASGRCLSPSAGTAGCHWQLPPGPVTGPGGLCVDVANAQPASGTGIQLYTCNGSDAQRWSAPGDQTVRVFGKCLDVVNGATANGSPVHLWDCNGSGAQTWVTRADGTWLNPQSGRCLDDPDNAQQVGDALRIWDCNPTTAQKYRLG